jgi:hypothetical protein
MDELGLDIDMGQVEQLCAMIEKGTTRHAACRLVGLMPATLTNLLKLGRQPPSRQPLVEERRLRMAAVGSRIAAAEASLSSKLGNTAISLALGEKAVDEETGKEIEIRKPDANMLKFVLERKYPDAWGAKSEVKHKGTVHHQVTGGGGRGTMLSPANLSDAQLAVVETLLLDMQQAKEQRERPALGVTDVEFVEGSA